jgi:glycosyltransferase involved in cell wall biosynthesis
VIETIVVDAATKAAAKSQQSPKLLRILYIGADDVPGGVTGYVNNIVGPLASLNIEFHAVVSEMHLEAKHLHSSIVRHPLPKTYNLVQLPYQVYKLRKIIAAYNFDVIHIHTARSGLLGCLASSFLDVKIVYTGHTWRFRQKVGKFGQFAIRISEAFICSKSGYLTFLSHSEEETARSLGWLTNKRFRQINTRIFRLKSVEKSPGKLFAESIPKATPAFERRHLIIGNIGSLTERKDPRLFFEIAERLLARGKHSYEFVWIGDGEQRSIVEELISTSSFASQFSLTGNLSSDEVAKRLKTFDAMLFTSTIEGVPLSIIEAQLSYVPVFSRSYDGVDELITDRQTGFIFDAAPLDIAVISIEEALSDRFLLCAVSARAHEVAIMEHCDPEIMASEYRDIYESLTRM